MSRLQTLVSGYHGRFLLAVAMGVGAIASSVGLLATAAYLISSAALLPPILDLSTAIVGVRFFGISRGVFRYVERIAGHDLSLRVSARLRNRVASALTALIPGSLGDTHSADLLLRIITDADAWQHIITRVVLPPIVAVVVVGLVVVVGALLLPAVGLILLASLLVAGAALPWLATRLGTWSEASVADDRRVLAETVSEIVSGAPEILTYGRADLFLDELAAVEDRLETKARRTAWSSGLTEALLVALIGITEISLLIVAVPAVVDGRLRGVNLAVVAILGLVSFEAVQDLPRAFQQLGASLESARRVEWIVDMAAPQERGHQTLSVPDRPVLSLRGIALRYPNRDGRVLEDLWLELPFGSRIAIRGRNGAGKTSLAHILLRFRNPDSGQYTIDGVPATKFDPDRVRSRIGLVDDRAFIFTDTVRANLLLGAPDADTEQLIEACKRVGLDGWLSHLPHGLDSPISSHDLSGGERRRLGVARALLADFSVLILDEPTAGLDPTTAELVIADILAATEGKTVLLITHGEEGLAAMDQVLTLTDGSLTASSGIHISGP